MTARPSLAVTLAGCLLLAGCAAPMGDGSPGAGTAERGADDPPSRPGGNQAGDAGMRAIAVANGSAPVDVNRTFARLTALLETAVPAPARVRVFRNRSAYRSFRGLDPSSNRSGDDSLTPFQEQLGLRTGPVGAAEAFASERNGYVSGLGTVGVYLAPNVSHDEARVVLVHELVHYVQLQAGHQSQVGAAADRTSDGRFAARSMIEGGAVYVTDAYLRAQGDNGTLNTDLYRRLVAAAPPAHALRFGELPYLAGEEYIDGRLDDPGSLGQLYADPPVTSEQVLHGHRPGDEPPAALSIDVATGPAWREEGTDRVGEALLRVALQRGNSRADATAAAAGWGNDSLRIVRSIGGNDGPSYVWVHRWDDAANASEYEAAARNYLDTRGNRTGDGWRLSDGEAALHRPTDRTTVLVFGPATFHDALGVDVPADGAVRIEVAEAEDEPRVGDRGPARADAGGLLPSPPMRGAR
jgi:hypothetical protein